MGPVGGWSVVSSRSGSCVSSYWVSTGFDCGAGTAPDTSRVSTWVPVESTRLAAPAPHWYPRSQPQPGELAQNQGFFFFKDTGREEPARKCPRWRTTIRAEKANWEQPPPPPSPGQVEKTPREGALCPPSHRRHSHHGGGVHGRGLLTSPGSSSSLRGSWLQVTPFSLWGGRARSCIIVKSF